MINLHGVMACDNEGIEDALRYYNVNSILGFSQQYYEDLDEFENDEGDN